jgi:hypothetical protein
VNEKQDTYLVQVRHGIVRRWRKHQIDVRELMRHHSQRSYSTHDRRTHEWITGLASKFRSQELNYSLETIRRRVLVGVHLHDRGIPHCFEAYENCSLQH